MQTKRPTYQLLKNGEVIMEEQTINAERAIELFYLEHPEIFKHTGYEVKVKKELQKQRG